MRIKRGTTKKARHAKALDMAKGYRMSYHKVYRRAKEAILHAGQYSYAHRKHRRGQIRTEWIETISSALVAHNISYSKFVKGMKDKNVLIDRKNLSELIVYNQDAFNKVVELVTK
jgi:large subunit ribosomal protein L20